MYFCVVFCCYGILYSFYFVGLVVLGVLLSGLWFLCLWLFVFWC